MSNGTSNVRRNTAIGLTAGLLGGGAIGLMLGVPGLTSAAGSSPSAVVAQEDTPTDDTTATGRHRADDTATDETVTDDTTVTDETTADDEVARPEPGVRLREQLQELVDNGTLTSEQADAVATFLVENRPEHGVPAGSRVAPAGSPEVVVLGTAVSGSSAARSPNCSASSPKSSATCSVTDSRWPTSRPLRASTCRP